MDRMELALQKLNELREVAPDETAELLDGLATLFVLRQDMTNPMLGAKVTLYLRPATTRFYVRPEDAPPEDERGWQYPYETTLESPDDEHFDWRWNDDPGEDEYPLEAVVYHCKDDGEAPDLVEWEAIVFEGNVAGDAPDGPLWDPNRQEYTRAEDYPLGTVNVIVGRVYNKEAPDGLIQFSESYPSDVEVYTSITPADGDPGPHEYTPGW